MTKRFLVFFAMASFVMTVPAFAYTISQTQYFTGIPDTSGSLTFNQFNTQGGTLTLQSIQVELMLQTSGGQLKLDNDSTSPVSGTFEFGAKGSLSSADVILLNASFQPVPGEVNAIYSQAFNLAANYNDGPGDCDSNAPDGLFYNGGVITNAKSDYVTDDVWYAGTKGFIGTGSYNIDYQVNQRLDYGSIDGVEYAANPVNVAGIVTVIYNYVSEPVAIDVHTKYWESGNYQLCIEAHAPAGSIASITISGPNYLDTATVNKVGDPCSSDYPKQLYNDGQHWDGDVNDAEWAVVLNIDAIPTVGEAITFYITYVGGSTEITQKAIDGVFSQTATLIWPTDGSTIDTTTPELQWQCLSIPGLVYSIQIDDLNHNRIYNVYDLSDGTTSHRMPEDYLNNDQTYYWLVSARDSNGNEALTNYDSFTIGETKKFPSNGKGMWIVTNYLVPEVLGKDINNVTFEESEAVLDRVISKLISVGAKWVAVKLGDGDSYYGDGNWCKPWASSSGIAKFHNDGTGIKVFGWQYVYAYDRWDIAGVSEADVANTILDIPGIDGLIINAECEYEETYPGPDCKCWRDLPQSKSEVAIDYMEAIRQRHPNSFIAYSTFARINSHPWFPYIEFSRYCDAAMPQAYWKDRPTNPTNEVQIMNQQWNTWHQTCHTQGYDDSIKPVLPMGQSSNQNGTVYCSGPEIFEFYQAIQHYGYGAASIFRYGKMTDDAWTAYSMCFNDFLVIGDSPIDMIVTDPDGLQISKESSEVANANYLEYDIDADGLLEDIVAVPKAKRGTYQIAVFPELNALPEDTYSLKTIIDTQTMVLAKDVPISQIPPQPYLVEYKLNRSDFDNDGDIDFADYATFAGHWSEEDCNYPGWCYGTDLDYNGSVDFVDLIIFSSNWLWGKIIADIDIDGKVDFADYAILARRWGDETCVQPKWCEGADLNNSGSVDLYDLAEFAEYWLEGTGP